MSELHDHLNTLAGRGNRRGADGVIAAARRDAEAEDNIVAVSLSEEQPRERRKGRSRFAAIGVAALLGVATLGISALVGGNGADSPEAAVRQLANAISNEDPLAALDVISPDEVRTLSDSVDSASRKAEELELVNAAGEPFAGIDLSVEGLELETEELAPGYVKVGVTGGTIHSETDPAGYSGFLQRVSEGAENSEGDLDLATFETGDQGPFVVVVQRDGSWYVSVSYTALEYLRESEGGAPADYGSARAQVATLGADSPEAAARDMLDAVATDDWERVLELVPPDEIPVYDYREWIIAESAETETSLTVDEFEVVESEVKGDTAVLTIAAVISDGDGGETYRFADDCATSPFVYGGEEESEICLGAMSLVGYGLLYANDLGPDRHDVRVTAVQRDGRWFLSPVGTAIDYLDEVIDRIDRDWLYATFGLAYELAPEAAITLGEPIEAQGGVRVFSLEGRADQEIIGYVGTEDNYGYNAIEIYTPDGDELDAWGVFQGEAVTLPADGTYKVVVSEFSRSPYTIWDAVDAPAYALEPPYEDSEFSESSTEAVASDTGSEEMVVFGQTVAVDVVGEVSKVYAFSGFAGQQVVGRITAPDGATYGFSTSLLGPDGVEEGYDLFAGVPSTLPVDGTYRVFVSISGNGAFQVTFWDRVNAPDGVVAGGPGAAVDAPPTTAALELTPSTTVS